MTTHYLRCIPIGYLGDSGVLPCDCPQCSRQFEQLTTHEVPEDCYHQLIGDPLGFKIPAVPSFFNENPDWFE